MLVAITAASATLTLGLILHGVTSQPYAQTRAATRGPDMVANVFPAGPDKGPPPGGGPSAVGLAADGRQVAALTALGHAPGVTGHSGPYPSPGRSCVPTASRRPRRWKAGTRPLHPLTSQN